MPQFGKRRSAVAVRGGREDLTARITQGALRRVAPSLVREMEVNRCVGDWVMPRDSTGRDPSTRVPVQTADCTGIDLRPSDQLDRFCPQADRVLNRLGRLRRCYRLFAELRTRAGGSDPSAGTGGPSCRIRNDAVCSAARRVDG